MSKPKTLCLSSGDRIGISEARRFLRGQISDSTLYRWASFGEIDNPLADELLQLHLDRRIIPSRRDWRGFGITRDGELYTPGGHVMTAYQIDQLAWVQALWVRNVEALTDISSSLKQIQKTPQDFGALRAVNLPD